MRVIWVLCLRLFDKVLSIILKVKDDAPGELRHSVVKTSLKFSVDTSAARLILFANEILSELCSLGE